MQDAPDPRRHPRTVMATDTERRRIRERAEAAGMAISRFVRQRAAGLRAAAGLRRRPGGRARQAGAAVPVAAASIAALPSGRRFPSGPGRRA